MVILSIAAAMFTQYWGPGFGVAPATAVLLLVIVLMNACGVRVRCHSTRSKEIRLAMVDLWEFRMGLQMDENLADSPRLLLHDCSQSWRYVVFNCREKSLLTFIAGPYATHSSQFARGVQQNLL